MKKLSVFLVINFLLLTSVAQALTFIDVWEFRVEGNELLAEEEVQRTLAPFLGAERSIGDIDKAAQALQQRYRGLGYPAVFVEVPQQDVLNGIVKIQVTETELRRVSVTGSRYFKLSEIRKNMPSVQEGKPLNLPSLQDDLQRVNALNPDLKLVPLLNQGPTQETIDLELSVADERPVHGSVSINNYHTETTTPTRISASLEYTNLWQKHHKLSIQTQTSPENEEEVKVLSANYVMPLGLDGKKLALYGVKSDSDLASLTGINVLGEGIILGARYILPFIQKPSELHSFVLGFDYKDFDETIDVPGGDAIVTPIDYVVWSAQYNLIHRSENISDSLSAGLSFGIRDLVNDNDEFDEKRSLGEPNFTFLRVDWTRRYQLPKEFSFGHKITAHYSDTALVSNEQLSAGGVSTVRGYFESQVQGDSGYIVNLDVTTPDISSWVNKTLNIGWTDSLEFYSFYDLADLSKRRTELDEDTQFNLSSVGLGLKASFLKQLDLKIDAGMALEDEGVVEKGTVRTRASLTWDF